MFLQTKTILIIVLSLVIIAMSKEQKESKKMESVSKLMEITTKNGIKVYGAFIDNLSLPLLIYKNVFKKGTQKKKIASFLSNNKWSANGWSWGSGASPTPHYHDNCHETLIVLRGSANIKWGISGNIAGTAFEGDVIFQPAGCYHAGNGCSNDCVTMGVYPDGSPGWYFCHDAPNKKQIESINKVPIASDPVFGGDINKFTQLLQQQCKI